MYESGPVTRLLEAAGRGDSAAKAELWSTVYEELHRIAQSQVAREAPGPLQATVLVNEAYLRLVGNGDVQWADRRHFFGAAAKAMRCICIDGARRRRRLKRGGDRTAYRLDGRVDADVRSDREIPANPGPFDGDPTQLLAIDEALTRLEQIAPRQAEVVMLRYFGGLTVEQTADALELAPRTVNAEWRLARAWLHRELTKGDTRID